MCSSSSSNAIESRCGELGMASTCIMCAGIDGLPSADKRRGDGGVIGMRETDVPVSGTL